MVFEELKKQIKKAIEAGYPDFAFEPKGEGLSFTYKKHADPDRRIGCYLLRYTGFFILKGFNAVIAYPELESILLPVLVKHGLMGPSALKHPSTITIAIQEKAHAGLHLAEPNLEIRSPEDIGKCGELFRSFIEREALPFFSQWERLTVLHDFAQDLQDEAAADILGALYPFKMAAIKRLCDDPGYRSYMDSYCAQQKEYYDEDPEEENNIRYYGAAKELKEILDKTIPLYK